MIAVVFAGTASAQRLPVIVVPGFEVDDLERWEGRGAVGLLVAGAGPEVSGAAAERMLELGVVRNSLRDGLPTGTPRITVERAADLGGRRAGILLGLPDGPPRPHDRRYPIVVVANGYRGLLTSDSTRIPGLVSIADIAPTALGEDGALGTTGGGVADLRTLDRRIDEHNEWRSRTATWVELAAVATAVVSAPAALLGVAAMLTANLALGAVRAPPLLALLILVGAVVGGLAAARVVRTRRRLAIVLASVFGAYLVSFVVDDRWVALSPLGPTQNARFYGISNLLETLLLVPALAAAALAGRRWPLGALVAVLAFVTVSAASFGADGGGAVVLAVGFAVLAGLAAEARGRTLGLLAAGAVVTVLVLLALEAATGASSHVTRALADGPVGLAGDLADRIELSWRRATANASTAITTVAALGALALLTFRVARLGRPLRDRALPLAFAAAVATSMVVNDSPKDVALAGLAGYLVVEAAALGGSSALARPAARLGRRHELGAVPTDTPAQ